MELKRYFQSVKGSLLLYFVLQIIETKSATLDVPAALESRIVNGDQVRWEGTRYQVFIGQLDITGTKWTSMCGGSIIARNTILTAAHCFWDSEKSRYNNASEYMIMLGNIDLNVYDKNTLIISVREIIPHEKYNYHTSENDLALVILNHSIPKSFTRASVIQINENRNLEVGTKCIATGWGLTSEMGAISTHLMYTNAPILNTSECASNYLNSEYKINIRDGMLCAGYMSGERDACSGDSGGPLVCDDLLVGIISFGIGCARPDYPGIYTDVAYYANTWILEKAGLVEKYKNKCKSCKFIYWYCKEVLCDGDDEGDL